MRGQWCKVMMIQRPTACTKKKTNDVTIFVLIECLRSLCLGHGMRHTTHRPHPLVPNRCARSSDLHRDCVGCEKTTSQTKIDMGSAAELSRKRFEALFQNKIIKPNKMKLSVCNVKQTFPRSIRKGSASQNVSFSKKPSLGIEPRTFRLQVWRSATKLRRLLSCTNV